MIILLILFSLDIKYVKSKANYLIELSFSLKQSIIIFLCLATAFISWFKTYLSIYKEQYLLLASLWVKNLPKILIPNVFKELVDSIAKIVLTHSNNTALPVFLLEEVVLATYNKLYINKMFISNYLKLTLAKVSLTSSDKA